VNLGELESALARTESDALASARVAETALRAAKKLVAAARSGNLGDIDKTLTEVDAAIRGLAQQFTNTKEGWRFDAASYAATGGLRRELRETAMSQGLSVYEQEDKLFSYPSLLRVVSGKSNADVAIEVDRKKTRSVRPSVVVARLKGLRDRPPRFNAKRMIESLYEAYGWAIKAYGSQPRLKVAGMGPSAELWRIYDLLTMFPGQATIYSRQEFTRDLYLLDRSGIRTTGSGAQMFLSPPRGTTVPRQFRLVDEQGTEQAYYSVAFSS
jgi:hypothetical protein